MFTLFDYCPPPPPPLHAAVRSLILLLHGFGTSTLSRSPPCSRGDVLHPRDPALVRGACIARAMGSRNFGWLPWFSWKPTLVVENGGEMNATRPDGTRVSRTSIFFPSSRQGVWRSFRRRPLQLASASLRTMEATQSGGIPSLVRCSLP